MYIDRTFLGEGVSRGGGSQTSRQFNLLYRLHSAISKKDAEWTEMFFHTLVPEELKNDKGFGENAFGLRQRRSGQRAMRTQFWRYQARYDGRFRDEDLVRILIERINDHAGKSCNRLMLLESQC